MLQLRTIGVFLTDEPGDDAALAFTARIAVLANAEAIICVHVRAMEDLAPHPVPDAEAVRQMILQKLPADLVEKTTVEVHQNSGVREILVSARDKKIDLAVVGRRLPHDQLAAGSAFVRLARKAPCSVMVVPDVSLPHFGKLLVPFDASEHSRLALEMALGFARANSNAQPEVVALHVFTVGYGYGYTGLSFAAAVDERKQVMQRQMETFVRGLDTSGVKFEVACISSERPIEAVYDFAASRNLQMIFMGSRGRSTGGAVLLGSFAERVMANCAMPMMIVKRKGETLHLLDALLSG